MPSVRIAPKWLAFLISITLSLAALSAIGCSGDDDKSAAPPSVYSQETGIANITLSKGKLEPAFSDDVRNYGISPFYVTTSSLDITVALKDFKSRLTINGQERNSGQAATIALNRESDTAIQISVQAEDGNNFNVVTLTAKVMPLNTTVYVYDSVAGNPLNDAKLSIRDARTGELLASGIDFPASAQGTVFLGLDKNRRYNIYARRPDTAEACFSYFDPSWEDTVTLYSRRDWVIDLPASAPIIADIAFAARPPSGLIEDLEWMTLPFEECSRFSVSQDNTYYLKVTAIAENNIWMEVDRGAIMAAIDDLPQRAVNNMRYLGALYYGNTPVVVNGKRYMMTDAVFVAADYIIPGDRILNIVVYDWANNRTEQRVYLDVTTTSTIEDNDPAALTPTWVALNAHSYGISNDFYSAEPIEEDAAPLALPEDPAGPMGDYIITQIAVSSGGAYRGFEVERATSPNGPWKLVLKRTYNTLLASQLSQYDRSAELMGGATYYYRAKFFNTRGYSSYTDVRQITTLPSFNVNLVSPANHAVSETLYPTFRFRVTNPALLDANVVDTGIFSIYARDKNGAEYVMTRFRINYYAPDEEGNPLMEVNYPLLSVNWIEANSFVWIEDDGIIAVDTKLAEEYFGDQFTIANFQPGVAYEWNIFGDRGSANPNWNTNEANMMTFYKNYGATGFESFARSRSSIPGAGFGATNGYFTLIMRDDAE
ncbi:MAG: hypothetical protein LBQ86_06225 [Holophagales bacterium]|jgi:hypothetical protein|nr:hypothetical protein [Holophagales bacterium]